MDSEREGLRRGGGGGIGLLGLGMLSFYKLTY